MLSLLPEEYLLGAILLDILNSFFDFHTLGDIF